jgi:hypothetical protein
MGNLSREGQRRGCALEILEKPIAPEERLACRKRIGGAAQGFSQPESISSQRRPCDSALLSGGFSSLLESKQRATAGERTRQK